MPHAGHRLSNEQLEQWIGTLLRWGVLLSASVVLAGGAIWLFQHGGEAMRYGVFRGEPAELRSVRGVLAGVLSLRGPDLIQLGLLLLIATPIARVLFSVVVFAFQRDRLYVAVTLTVLTVLLYSLVGPHP